MEYVQDRLAEIDAYNRAHDIDWSPPVNGRHLTNLGIFRAYLVAYLGANKHINHDLTCMMRQLAPGTDGTPLEVYGFVNNPRWVPYEGVQSDIFDHVFAVIPQSGLRLHQSPTGHDVRRLGERLAAAGRAGAAAPVARPATGVTRDRPPSRLAGAPQGLGIPGKPGLLHAVFNVPPI